MKLPRELAPPSELSRDELAQQKLALCSRVVGEAFFPTMVEALAEALSVRCVLLCMLHPLNPRRARTVAAWNGGPVPDIEYELEDTPCANIIGQGTCLYPAGIVDLFPRDTMLREMGAESYVGAPLRSASGEVLGLLAVIDDKPMQRAAMVSEVVEVFAGRAAAELERLSAASMNERLGRIVEDSVSEVYLFDPDTYRFKLVNRGARENLGYSMEELRSLTPWDLKPGIDRERFEAMVEPLRTGERPHLVFETAHRRKNGTLYDVAVQLQLIGGVESVFYASITDITERKRAQEAQARLAAIVASSAEAIISKDMDGTIKTWNAGAEQIFGYAASEMIGTSIRRLIPPDRQSEEDEILRRIGRGEQLSSYETVRVCRDGRRVQMSVTISPIFDSSGAIVGASKIGHDISERKRAEERERLLMREVNHRAKNLLALVEAIARQTAYDDTETFVEHFGERIRALAASQDVLVHSGWQDVPLDELVHSQLAHFRDALGQRIHVSGPPLKITAAAAQAFGLALHELATNAVKHGALSGEEGTVSIAWSLVQEGEVRFVMAWRESGGPAVAYPTRRGFGSTVIDDMIRISVSGEVELDFAPTGLTWRLTCPAGKVLEAADMSTPAAGLDAPSSARGARASRRILLVEDEALIALEIAQMLKDGGFEVVGPATSVLQALGLLKRSPCDAAVLDVNLGGETAEPVAEVLLQARTPFLTVSSYGMTQRPQVFAAAPHLDKPLRAQDLLRALAASLAREGVSADA